VKVLRLPRTKVHVGEPLAWNVRDEQGVLLLTKGHVIESEHQLELMLQRGAFVDVAEIRAQVEGDTAHEAPHMAANPNLFALWDKTPQELRELLSHLTDQPDFAGHIDWFAHHLVELVDCQPDVSIYRTVRQDHAENFYYGYSHAVHTAVLCVFLARHLHWPVPRMMSLVKAALTMNIAIMELQGQMAAQDVPMKERQKVQIHGHPEHAVAQLKTAGITDALWLTAIEQHHEHLDGSGYPKGLTAMDEMAVALRVTDAFMAKISPRTFRSALTPQEAVRQLVREDHGGPVSNAIIQEFGIYPPGDFVKLANGELCVVVLRTGNVRAPIVAAITDTAGRPVARTVRRDTAQPEFAIAGIHADHSLLARLPPERLYGDVQLHPRS